MTSYSVDRESSRGFSEKYKEKFEEALLKSIDTLKETGALTPAQFFGSFCLSKIQGRHSISHYVKCILKALPLYGFYKALRENLGEASIQKTAGAIRAGLIRFLALEGVRLNKLYGKPVQDEFMLSPSVTLPVEFIEKGLCSQHINLFAATLLFERSSPNAEAYALTGTTTQIWKDALSCARNIDGTWEADMKIPQQVLTLALSRVPFMRARATKLKLLTSTNITDSRTLSQGVTPSSQRTDLNLETCITDGPGLPRSSDRILKILKIATQDFGVLEFKKDNHPVKTAIFDFFKTGTSFVTREYVDPKTYNERRFARAVLSEHKMTHRVYKVFEHRERPIKPTDGGESKRMSLKKFIESDLPPGARGEWLVGIHDESSGKRSFSPLEPHVLDEKTLPPLMGIFSEPKELQNELQRMHECRLGTQVMKSKQMFITKGFVRGNMHFDDFDVIYICISGTRTLSLAHSEVGEFITDKPNTNYSPINVTGGCFDKYCTSRFYPFTQVTLHPGDVVFIPARMWHQVDSEAPPGSLSIAINCCFFVESILPERKIDPESRAKFPINLAMKSKFLGTQADMNQALKLLRCVDSSPRSEAAYILKFEPSSINLSRDLYPGGLSDLHSTVEESRGGKRIGGGPSLIAKRSKVDMEIVKGLEDLEFGLKIEGSVIVAYFRYLRNFCKGLSLSVSFTFIDPSEWGSLISDGRRAKSLKSKSILSQGLLFVPVNQNKAHWYLGVVDLRSRNIYSLDSKAYEHPEFVGQILVVLKNLWTIEKKEEPFPVFMSGVPTSRTVPIQGNDADCGIFVMLYAEALASGGFPEFNLDIKQTRSKIARLLKNN